MLWVSPWGCEMKTFLKFWIVFALLPITLSCGSGNFFECSGGHARSKCSKLTKDEEARRALDNDDLDTAVTLLSELVAEEPSNYQRYPLLAAAYAGKSGFDIFNVATASFGNSTTLLQTMSEFLPSPTALGDLYSQSLDDMNSSITTLSAIPEDLRATTSSDKYATSAVLQLTLYQAAYGVMVLNKFTYGVAGYDPTLLSTMTAEDAAMILHAFIGAATTASGGTSTSVSDAILAIQSQPGATDAEKIAAWSQAAR